MTDAALGLHLHARIIERRSRDDVDVARDRLAGHVGGDGLADDDLRGDRRGDGVEPGVAAFGADDVDAVDRQRGPVDRCAAKRDVARLALIALDADAGKTADRLRDVLVGQATDRIGGDDRDERRAGPLDLERGGFGLGDRPRAGNDDLVTLACVRTDFGGHRDVERYGGIGDRHRPVRVGEADIADHQFVRTGGDADQREPSGAIDHGRQFERRDRDRCTVEIVAAACLRHGTGDAPKRTWRADRGRGVGTRKGAGGGQRSQRAASQQHMREDATADAGRQVRFHGIPPGGPDFFSRLGRRGSGRAWHRRYFCMTFT